MKTHGKSRIPILLNGSVRVTYLRSPFDRVWSFRGRVYGPATKPLTESGTNGWRAECGYKLIPNTSTVSFKELHRVLCRLKRCKRLDSSTFQTAGKAVDLERQVLRDICQCDQNRGTWLLVQCTRWTDPFDRWMYFARSKFESVFVFYREFFNISKYPSFP